MGRIAFIALIAVAVVFWLLWRNQPNAKARRAFAQKGIVFAALAVIAILVVTGRMHWLGAAIAAVIPLLRPLLFFALQNIPLMARLYQRYANSSKTQESSVSSRYLAMQLDHESGELNGSVLDGEFAGRELSGMNRDELLQLLNFCRLHDADSARLLESYLEQRFQQNFDEAASEQTEQYAGGSGAMNEAEALAILGLQGEPSQADIIAAHRTLMQKLHPDRGGNDYLASKVNEARDYLMERY